MELFVAWCGFSILLLFMWHIAEAFDGIDTSLTRLRILFYILLLPGTIFWGIILAIAVGIILGLKWLAERSLISKAISWLTDPL